VSSLGYALVFDYNGQGNLATACGYNLTLAAVNAASSCAGSTFKVGYVYNTAGVLLTSVTDTGGGIFNMSYVPYGNGALPTCISLRNSATCEVTNQFGGGGLILPDQVTLQTTATGDVWTYDYRNGEDPNDLPPVAGQPRWTRAWHTDGAGHAFSFQYDRGLLIKSTSPQGAFTYRYSQFSYVAASPNGLGLMTVDFRGTLPRLITTGDGDVEYYEHNLRGEVTKLVTLPRGTNVMALTTTNGGTLVLSGPALSECCTAIEPLVVPAGAIVVSQAFLPDWGGVGYLAGQLYVMGCGVGPADDKRCSKPISQTDANGNQTDYEYSAVHGGIVTETGPAPAPGGVRPQTRYSYVQRQAFILGAGGSVVAAGPPVWMLAAKSVCKTSQWNGSACAVANDEVRTTYDYGPTTGLNNLNLRGEVVDAAGMALRTCYAYDWRGLRTSVTSPRAGLGVCP
jgi:hypothetical protein